MSKFALAKGASGLVLGGAAAAGAVVVGLYVSGSLFPSSEQESPAETAAVLPTAESQPADPATPDVVEAPAPEATPEPEPVIVAEPEPEVAPEPEPEIVAEPEVAEETTPEVIAEAEPEVAENPEPVVAEEQTPETVDDPAPVVSEMPDANAPEVAEETATTADVAPEATKAAPEPATPVDEPVVAETSDAETPEPVAQTEPVVEESVADTVVDEPAQEDIVEDDTTPTDEPVVEEAAPEPVVTAEPEAPSLIAPGFDVVRVSPDGQTLVAGSAPGARDVLILVDGTEVGSASVDGSGKFVAFLDLPVSGDPRVISLLSTGEAGQIESTDQVILAPSVQVAEVSEPVETGKVAVADVAEPAVDTPTEEPATAEPETTEILSTDNADVTEPEVVAETTPDQPEPSATAAVEPDEPAVVEETAVLVEETAEDITEPAADAPSEVAEITTPEPEPAQTEATPEPEPNVVAQAPAAPAVILSNEEGVEVLQSSGAAPQVLDQIALDAITYEDAGSVALTGRGTVDEFVRVYLDNQPILTTEVGEDGRWRADLPNVDSGTYTLRVDAVDTTGDVLSRVESPFRREDPEALARATERGEGASTVQVVTVQPGNTLWAIARDRYGEGPAYVRVFEANRDRIRNPDLIYPGQVFSIPE